MTSPQRTFWLCLLLPVLFACSPISRSEQPNRSEGVPLGARQAVGQTFLSRYQGLQAIEVFLDPQKEIEGDLFLHLKERPKSRSDLRMVSLPLNRITSPGFQRFQFEPIPDSEKNSYYFYLRTGVDPGPQVGSAGADVYQNGSQYINDLGVNAQTAFRLAYNPYMFLVGLAGDSLVWLWYILAAFLLFCLPGWAILAWLLPDWSGRSLAEKATLSIGASLPVYPLLLLWTNVIGVHLGPVFAWLPPLLAAIALMIQNRHRFSSAKLTIRNFDFVESAKNTVSNPPWSGLAFFLLAGLLFAVRFWPVRTLPAPMWGDSYQHTLISQLIVDHGGLFQTWEPYADLVTFTYHFGFHALVAVFHWLTGLSLPLATLWVGQIINVLAVLALYPLAVRVGRNQWAGVFAVLVAGLLSPMPMFYTNWGRYTQLAGQTILPAAVLAIWVLLQQPKPGWRPTLLASFLFAGLALTHYRILIFAAIFIAAFLILYSSRARIFGYLRSVILIAVGAGILFLPWFVRVFSGKLPVIFRAQISTPASQVSAFTQQYNAIGDLFTYLPVFLWVLLPVLLAWGFWRRDKGFALVSLWWFLIFLSANPQWFRLPGSGVISNFAVLIAAYMPASLLAGTGVGWAYDYLRKYAALNGELAGTQAGDSKRQRRVEGSFFLLVTLTILICARPRLRDIQPSQFALVTWPDVHAASWIDENLPQEARFLVNSFLAYGEDVIVGADGGWWLPVLAKRDTTLPPINYGSEKGPRPDYRQWTNALTEEILENGPADPEVLSTLKERGVTHVYIGQQQGRVNNAGATIEPAQLLASPFFTPIYHQDRVWIFEINYP